MKMYFGWFFRSCLGSKQATILILSVICFTLAMFLYVNLEHPYPGTWISTTCSTIENTFYEPCRDEFECRVCRVSANLRFKTRDNVIIPYEIKTNVYRISKDDCDLKYPTQGVFQCYHPSIEDARRNTKTEEEVLPYLLANVHSRDTYLDLKHIFRSSVKHAQHVFLFAVIGLVIYFLSGMYMLIWLNVSKRYQICKWLSMKGLLTKLASCCLKRELTLNTETVRVQQNDEELSDYDVDLLAGNSSDEEERMEMKKQIQKKKTHNKLVQSYMNSYVPPELPNSRLTVGSQPTPSMMSPNGKYSTKSKTEVPSYNPKFHIAHGSKKSANIGLPQGTSLKQSNLNMKPGTSYRQGTSMSMNTPMHMPMPRQMSMNLNTTDMSIGSMRNRSVSNAGIGIPVMVGTPTREQQIQHMQLQQQQLLSPKYNHKYRDHVEQGDQVASLSPGNLKITNNTVNNKSRENSNHNSPFVQSAYSRSSRGSPVVHGILHTNNLNTPESQSNSHSHSHSHLHSHLNNNTHNFSLHPSNSHHNGNLNIPSSQPGQSGLSRSLMQKSLPNGQMFISENEENTIFIPNPENNAKSSSNRSTLSLMMSKSHNDDSHMLSRSHPKDNYESPNKQNNLGGSNGTRSRSNSISMVASRPQTPRSSRSRAGSVHTGSFKPPSDLVTIGSLTRTGSSHIPHPPKKRNTIDSPKIQGNFDLFDNIVFQGESSEDEDEN